MLTKLFSLGVMLLHLVVVSAQGVAVGSGNPDVSAMLDVQSNDKGLLIPRLTAAQRGGIASPATGLLVYQTDGTAGFYFNSGTPGAPAWTLLSTASWRLGGNAGTNPAIHPLGTTDANNLRIITNNTDRVVVRSNGQVLMNGTAFKSGLDGLEVLGSGVAGAVGNFGFPINGYTGNNAFAGIYGENQGSGQGVLGANSGTGSGVYGINTNITSGGPGVYGISTIATGVWGQTNTAFHPGVMGFNANAGGIGVVGLGTNIANFENLGTGAGVLAQAENFGLIAFASTSGAANTVGKWAGYFDYRPGTNSYAYIGGRSGTTDYAILSNGVKSTMVKDEQNRNRIMYCPEAPEVLFQDVGVGQLVNGRAHITIDPVLARNIYVSESKPLKVFIQLEGDCNGVYVTNKSAAGFDVVELKGGASNTPFTWQIIANRGNSTDAAGRVTSRFADNRFPVGPDRIDGGGKVKARTISAAPLQLPGKLPSK